MTAPAPAAAGVGLGVMVPLMLKISSNPGLVGLQSAQEAAGVSGEEADAWWAGGAEEEEAEGEEEFDALGKWEGIGMAHAHRGGRRGRFTDRRPSHTLSRKPTLHNQPIYTVPPRPQVVILPEYAKVLEPAVFPHIHVEHRDNPPARLPLGRMSDCAGVGRQLAAEFEAGVHICVLAAVRGAVGCSGVVRAQDAQDAGLVQDKPNVAVAEHSVGSRKELGF
ncbi:unnamed protein product [Tuber aestivum]|uniref:Uncharacterized protein n=1 Tax=Tuber aestivum TaxID=59557 RepID=A0A292Q545_9PEZI|nr:unnamed protein product [Tuber aestivum]